MSTTATLPLPLALTEPEEWSSVHEKRLKRVQGKTEIKYNPLTQLQENAEGVPHFLDMEYSVTVSITQVDDTFSSDNSSDV
jgi:hypothetical protein